MRGTTILITSAGGVRFTPSIAPSPMAPHAVRLLVGVEDDVHVEASATGHRGRVLATRPDREHVARSDGPALCFLFDPEHTGARALLDGCDADVAVLDGPLAAAALAIARGCGPSIADAATLRDVLARTAALLPRTPPRLDWRVGRALQHWLLARGELPAVEDVAKRVGLSPGHFRQLFTADIGIPARRYRTWVLLLRAFRVQDARSVTEIAHEAGFTDLAHFARACRTFLGVTAIGAHLRDRAPREPALRTANNLRSVQARERAAS